MKYVPNKLVTIGTLSLLGVQYMQSRATLNHGLVNDKVYYL